MIMGINASKSNEKRINLLLEKHGIKKETLEALQNRMSASFENGVINKTQFVKMYLDYYKNESIVEIAERIFDSFDFDKNGVLNNKEVAILISLKNMKDQDRLSFIFDIFDKNNDKKISHEEYVELVKAQALFKGKYLNVANFEEELKRIFQYMDTSGDGVIEKSEFTKALNKDPSLFDLF